MTTTSARPRASEMSGAILTEAARRMLPVLAGRVLAAVADRAVARVDGLADRLDRTHDGSAPTNADAPSDDDASAGGQGRAGAAVGFLLEQARLFLAFVVRLAAQALEMLRRATEKLRERRAPAGIDEAPEPDEITAPEDLDDEYDEDADEDEFEDEYEDEYEDDETEERATVDA